MKKTYQERKEETRQAAIEFQSWQSGRVTSWLEMALYSKQLTKLAKRYGLIQEFKENAII